MRTKLEEAKDMSFGLANAVSRAALGIQRLIEDGGSDDITMRRARDAAEDTAAAWNSLSNWMASEDGQQQCERRAAEYRSLGDAPSVEKHGATDCANRLTTLLAQCTRQWAQLIDEALRDGDQSRSSSDRQRRRWPRDGNDGRF